MNEFQALSVSGTGMLAIDTLLPVTDIPTLIIEETWLTLEHSVATRITEVVRRAIIRIWIELWLSVRTLDCAVHKSRLCR